jgi:hypothetical protein
VIATKWYTSSRSLGAGEGWEYFVPSEPRNIQPGSGKRLIGRTLPFGWNPENYGDQQIGPEQFIWRGQDSVIFAKNIVDESAGTFMYSKGAYLAVFSASLPFTDICVDVHKGIYAIFSQNLTTGVVEKLVDAFPGGASRPELSRDGRTLAFVRRVRDKEALVLK